RAGECASAIYHLRVFGLRCLFLSPEWCQVQVGPAVIDSLELPGWGLAFGLQTRGCIVQCRGENASALIAVVLLLVAEGFRQCQELTEGVPAQVVFFL